MDIAPISLGAANQFVAIWHRHARPVVGHLWSLGLWADLMELQGVAIIGRPLARALDDGETVEITRLATDGTRNACSRLYGAACREARRRGYQRVITYTLATEPGSSLRAANFRAVATVRGRQWDTPTRPRAHRDVQDRVRWQWDTWRVGRVVRQARPLSGATRARDARDATPGNTCGTRGTRIPLSPYACARDAHTWDLPDHTSHTSHASQTAAVAR